MKDNDRTREQLIKKLRESEEFGFSLLNSSPNPMIVINPDTSVKYVNPALEKLTGFSSGEIIGTKAPYPWWTEKTLKKTGKDLEKAMREGATRIEELFRKKSGERFWVEITSGPIIKEGKFRYYIANWTDITERRKAESELKQYKFMVESAHDAVFFKNLESRYVIANNKAIEAFGVPRGEVIGKNDYELMPDQEEARKNVEDDQRVFKTGKPVELTKRMTGANKKKRWFQAIKVPQFDDKGNIVGLVGIARDITERKEAETELKESELKLKEQKKALEEKNIALSELIGQIELEKRKVKEEIASNVDEILLPIVERLGMKGASRKYGELLKYHLESISSSFGREITRKTRKLTPREVEICSVIKGGLTNKEISQLLNISYQTVEKHRKNIRKKLDLSDKKINLTTYLNQI